MKIGVVLSVNALAALTAISLSAQGLPKADLDFLRDMTRDVVEASRVKPGSNGGGRWPLTNSCGFTLITPGKDTYTAFWIRDFSMAVDSGFITAEELRNHLLLTCKAQNGPAELKLANGLHVPAWAIPDHINYDGRATFYPGTYASGHDQGSGACGRVPPIDDHYEFVHIAYTYWKATHDAGPFAVEVKGTTVFERLEKAFACPTTDPETGLAQTTEADRAVGFGFCDAETHTGKLLFASLLRYRAAGELAELAKALGHRERVAGLPANPEDHPCEPGPHLRRPCRQRRLAARLDRFERPTGCLGHSLCPAPGRAGSRPGKPPRARPSPTPCGEAPSRSKAACATCPRTGTSARPPPGNAPCAPSTPTKTAGIGTPPPAG